MAGADVICHVESIRVWPLPINKAGEHRASNNLALSDEDVRPAQSSSDASDDACRAS
jgi:hypothetical protein